MIRLASLAAALVLVSACAPAGPAQSPEPAKEAPAPAEPTASASAAPSAEPAAAPDAPKAAADSPAEALAHDLVKSGGRRIGFSASKKRFVVPIEARNGGARGLDLRFYDDEGAQREILRVCQPGECDEHLNELAKQLMPQLVARLEREGYESISSVGWPSGRDELDVGSLNGKLRYERGKLSLATEKKATPLRPLGGRSPKTDALSAVYPVPAAKVLGAFAEGETNVQDFFVFKLP